MRVSTCAFLMMAVASTALGSAPDDGSVHVRGARRLMGGNEVAVKMRSCITRSGEVGNCISISDCTGTAITWAQGDPEPNCFEYPKGIQCCVKNVATSVDEEEEGRGPTCITSTGDEGTCIDVSKCTGTSVPWSPNDPEPNCFVYPKGIQCCVESNSAVKKKVEDNKCMARSGKEGSCLSIPDCAGTSVPWSQGDPEPNCFAYPKGVQCCLEAVKSLTDDSKAIVIVEDIPKAPCSLSEDVVVCSSTDRDCSSFIIDSCSVYCQDESSCQDTDINASSVECVGKRSCYGASFHQSDITCSKQDWYSCQDAEFFASAVTCEDGYSTCDEDMFYPCSCCKSLSPDCHAEPCFDRMTGTSDKFCSSLFLGKSCKAWGNPICDGVAVSSPAPIHSSGTCSLREEIAVCDSTDRGCNNMQIENCSVYCQDACQSADITASTVECVGRSSCYGATFRQSDITCSDLQWYACRDAKFIASAVTCQDGYYTCDEDEFYPCSCCKSPSPDCHAEPCFDRMTRTADSFCSSTFLGKTCKDWGNPICGDVS
eukprot:CAMPEP_0181040278 /NCGR_PEP_ID=MMETSP1070-20121207/10959_1 /TAXON_ID=265543 /ORGANISM="Minutocellus polymorphus, Strain NH13" /LENGTH=539 /DNA_ID=CAMNT_0023118269 /DNA_START=674 /DNA_END=2289 /DNA_ORIENTATION=+